MTAATPSVTFVFLEEAFERKTEIKPTAAIQPAKTASLLGYGSLVPPYTYLGMTLSNAPLKDGFVIKLQSILPRFPFFNAVIVGRNRTALIITPKRADIPNLINLLKKVPKCIFFRLYDGSSAYSTINHITINRQLIPAVYQLKRIETPTATASFHPEVLPLTISYTKSNSTGRR